MKLKTAKACVLQKDKKFVIKDYPVPEPEPGTIVLRVELSGICGTDIHIYNDRFPGVPEPPIIFGHEVVGTIAALGEGVEKDLLGKGVKVGDRVCPIGAMGCNECFMCTVHHSPNRCPWEETFGFYPDADSSPYLSGGYAQYLYITRKNPPFIKTDICPESAVLLDSLATGVHAVQRASVKNGDTVVVQGTGIIGLLTLACAKLAGANKAIVVGGRKERIQYASMFGADEIISITDVPDSQERMDKVINLTPGGYGADIVFGCTGVVSSINEGLAYTRKSGTYAEVGNFCDTGIAEINMGLEIVQKNLDVLGVFAQTIEHFYRGVQILEEAKFPYEKLVTHKVGLDEVGEIFVNDIYTIDGKVSVKIAIDPWLE